MKEISDWSFVQKAMQNGDLQANKMITRFIEINKEIEWIKSNFRRYSPSSRAELVEKWKLLEKEKKSMLYSYNLEKKKARIYLQELRTASKR